VPTNFLGFVYYLALLVPGFLYLVGRERNGPERRLDPFRQAANVIFVSVISELTVLVLFSWLWLPLFNEKRLLTDTSSYWNEQPLQLLWLYLAGLAASSLLAYVASLPRARRAVNHSLYVLTPRTFRVSSREDVHPSVTSAWWRLFHHFPKSVLRTYQDERASIRRPWYKRWLPAEERRSVHTMALFVLTNGVQVQGLVDSFNPESNDTPDREVILKYPIQRRPSEESEWIDLPSDNASFTRGSIAEIYIQYFFDPEDPAIPEP
jgi:hypothetical protein